jgi:glycosyltransferase involved in cell wall biosynthesis
VKVLHISYSDLFGGAARSAFNIHNSLVSVGINSKMIVIKKQSNDKKIIEATNKINKLILKIKNYLLMIVSRFFYDGKSSFNFFSNKFLIKRINSFNADYVLFHWIHAEMLSIEDLVKINAKKIFVLHDMWWLGSHEHYFNEKNNIINLNKNLWSRIFNLSEHTLSRKKKIEFKNVVAPSEWLLKLAKKKCLKKNNFIKINYALNHKKFKPIKKLNLNNKNIKLLFVGFGKVDSDRKGIDLLIKVLDKINNKNLELLIIGEIDPILFSKLNIKVKFLKKISSDKKLNEIYNLSDILIFPSRQDNLPNVVLEAMSTGLPVIAFDIGGMKDLIKNNYNGYLCNPFNIKDFSKKLDNLILRKNLRKKFSLNSIKLSKKKFNYNLIGKKYLSYLKTVK